MSNIPIEVADGVFTVQGASRFGPGVSVTKTMTVLRQGTELTLINSARVDDDGERALRALGTVKHLVRLGCSHGLDDPWAIERFTPTYWGPETARLRGGHKPQHFLVDGGALPFAGTSFLFQHTKEGEAAVVVDRKEGGLLLTCDPLQAWRSTDGCSAIGKIGVRALGFMDHSVVVGRVWAKRAGLPGVADDFRRLGALPFTSFIGGHGVYLADARADVAAAVARVA